ncbi:hypothetical protein GCM10009759_50460 [Kitasatospora saccharophila]|uniref:Uncharacterized protein n=1 Tax=Kitasatospora saccharophila TaxID=407973 RepID=A0ABN2XE83_9ACTN
MAVEPHPDGSCTVRPWRADGPVADALPEPVTVDTPAEAAALAAAVLPPGPH